MGEGTSAGIQSRRLRIFLWVVIILECKSDNMAWEDSGDMQGFTPDEEREFREWWKKFFSDKDVTFSEDEMKQIMGAFSAGTQSIPKDNAA
jgi:hypothetical protein